MSLDSTKTTNVLAAANLFQNAQLSKELSKVSRSIEAQQGLQRDVARIQRESLDESKKQTLLLELAQKRDELRDAEERRLKEVKQVVFEVRQELDTLKASTDSAYDTLIKLLALRDQLSDHQITPSLVEEFSDKQYIKDLLDDLDRTLVESLTGSENSDLVDLVDKIREANSMNASPISEAIRKSGVGAQGLEGIADAIRQLIADCDERKTVSAQNLSKKSLKKMSWNPNLSNTIRLIKRQRLEKYGIGLLIAFCGFGGWGWTYVDDYWQLGLFGAELAEQIAFFSITGTLLATFTWLGYVRLTRVSLSEDTVSELKSALEEVEESLQRNANNRSIVAQYNKLVDEIGSEMGRLRDRYKDLSTTFRKPDRVFEGDYTLIE